MPFQRAFEITIESEEPILESGAVINVHWSPHSIFSIINNGSYTVDITLRVLDVDTSEWKVVSTLASDLKNNGRAEVTIPEIPEFDSYEYLAYPALVEVSVSAASMSDTNSTILNKIGNLGMRIVKQAPMRIIKKSVKPAEQRLACEAWALTQEDGIGQQTINHLPPCPCTAERAAAPNSGFREEKLSSVVKVTGATIADDAFRNYFHPGAASCYHTRVDNP